MRTLREIPAPCASGPAHRLPNPGSAISRRPALTRVAGPESELDAQSKRVPLVSVVVLAEELLVIEEAAEAVRKDRGGADRESPERLVLPHLGHDRCRVRSDQLRRHVLRIRLREILE